MEAIMRDTEACESSAKERVGRNYYLNGRNYYLNG
jgi:hypothetical protein